MQILNVRPGTPTWAEAGFDKWLHQRGPTQKVITDFFLFSFYWNTKAMTLAKFHGKRGRKTRQEQQ